MRELVGRGLYFMLPLLGIVPGELVAKRRRHQFTVGVALRRIVSRRWPCSSNRYGSLIYEWGPVQREH